MSSSRLWELCAEEDLLLGMLQGVEHTQKSRVGKALGARVGQVFGGLKITRTGGKGRRKYCLEAVDGRPSLSTGENVVPFLHPADDPIDLDDLLEG